MGEEKSLQKYFRIYGGWNALLSSKFLLAAMLLTIIMFRIWTEEYWWDLTIQVIPTLIGFTLGGFAILLAFGDEGFRSAILGESEKGKPSPYMKASVSFVHFIVLQTTSLLLSLIFKGILIKNSIVYQFLNENHQKILSLIIFILKYLLYGFSYLVFCYALTSILAATFAIFKLITWLEWYHTIRKQKPKPDEKNP